MLIGRDLEQRRIHEVVADARAGSSGALVLVGEPGIGKTALLDYAAEAALDFEVVRSRGVESEAEIPFGALFDVCRWFLDDLDVLAPPQRSALQAAFGIVERETSRFAVGAGTLALIAAAAERRPLLLLVDDAHWLDHGSADALAFAVRRLRADRVAALFAVRPGEGRAFELGHFPELELAGLDAAAAAALLGSRATRDLEREILEVARGNPLALLELPRQARVHDLVAEPMRLGKRLEQAFAARALQLPESTHAALLVAAASSTPKLEIIGRALAGLGLSLADLERAEAPGLVMLADATLEFRHPLVRSALYHAAEPADRRRAHAALAAALTDDDRRAWHLAAAAVGADDAAARALERAAETARRRSGFAAAAAAYERAARLSTGKADRARRLSRGADAAWLAGNTSRALELIAEALAETEDGRERGALLHMRGTIEHFVANPRAQGTLEEAAALLVDGDRPRACLSLHAAVGAALVGGDIERADVLSERLYAIADPDRPDERLLVALSRGGSLVMAGKAEEGRVFLELATAAFKDSALFADDPRHLSWAALAAFWRGDIDSMAERAAKAIEWAREHAAVGAVPFTARLLARAQLILGRWRAAHALLLESLEAARISGQAIHEADTLGTLAWLHAAQGRAQECRRDVERGLEIIEKTGVRWRNGLLQPLVLLELGLGVEQDSPAIERFHRELTLCPLRDTPANVTWPDLIEALIRVGNTDAAEELLAQFEDEAERLDQPFPRALGLRCRGLLAEDGSYEQQFERALQLHAVDYNGFATARTRLAYGERLRRSGRRIDSREQLRAALAVFDELAARPWSERARGELRASGQRLRRTDPAAADELTPQELQIAMLVAEAKTNREIGAQLFLSPKTIEWHLGHVYRKLSVRSRAEVARALYGDSPASERVATRV